MRIDAGPMPSNAAIEKMSPDADVETLTDVLLISAYRCDLETVQAALRTGLSIDTVDPETGMSALHLAVGRNFVSLAKFLVENGASFFGDNAGRWPTTIAAECEVSEAMCDYIVEAEAAAIGGRGID